MADGRESPDAEALPAEDVPGRVSRESPDSWVPGFVASGADWCKEHMRPESLRLKTQDTHVQAATPGAWTIEQAARTLEDTQLKKRPRAKKKGEGNASWLRDSLGIQEDTGVSDKAATNAVVRGAAGRGKIKILSSLYDEGQWDPWRCRLSIEAADEGGYLLDLLKAFIVHLSWYPTYAEAQEEEAKQELASAPEPSQRLLAKSPVDRELTQRTCLLSNLMLVNSPMAARVLEAAAEEMVVFKADAFEPVRRGVHKPFPDSLDLFYVRRRVKERDGLKMKYSRDRRELYLPDAKTPTATSRESPVTLPKDLRADVLVPLTAENFCFVYPCEELPLGGFLYIDTDGGKVTPLVVNEASRTPSTQAFAFGDPLPLSAAHTESISLDLQDLNPFCDPAVEPMMDAGALQYAWVNNNQLEGLDIGFLGGFAYTFSDPTLNRVFPLKAAGEVVRMANLSWEVNARALGLMTTGSEIQRHIAPRGEDRAAPVSIMRITAPDVIHPMMLHALAYTPREDVLATDVAKAISYAAFERAWPFYAQQAAFDLLSAMILAFIAYEVHRLQGTNGRVHWDLANWKRATAFGLILLVLVKNCYEELRKFIGFWKCKWMSEYMNPNTLKDLGSMFIVAFLIVQLATDFEGTDLESPGYLRTVLAAAGFFKWIKVVTYMRGILKLGLGVKFVPISYTLSAGTTFLLVMMFFIFATWHAFYSMNPGDKSQYTWSYMLSMTYNLGFLGDFDLDNILSEESTAGEVSYASMQQLLFAGASMLVTVMLTNIYIGVMGMSYELYHEKALVLFVRARASICLDIAMQYGDAWKAIFGTKGRKLEDEYVWFCRADADYDLASAQDDSNSSVRQLLGELRESVEKQVGALHKKFEDLSEQNPGLAVAGSSLGVSRTSHIAVPARASGFNRPRTSPSDQASAGGLPDGRPPAMAWDR